VDWYYKAGLIVGLIWAAARALGAYGESARELDINFLFGFLLTTGGWAAVFLVVDWVARFLGLRPKRQARTQAADGPKPPASPQPAQPADSPPEMVAARAPSRARRRRGR
jgi:hypothetical protein